jgi:hypothetical protein
MKALVTDMMLMISSPIVSADLRHGNTTVISRLTKGGVHRRTCANAQRPLRRLADTLAASGARPRNETDLE